MSEAPGTSAMVDRSVEFAKFSPKTQDHLTKIDAVYGKLLQAQSLVDRMQAELEVAIFEAREDNVSLVTLADFTDKSASQVSAICRKVRRHRHGW